MSCLQHFICSASIALVVFWCLPVSRLPRRLRALSVCCARLLAELLSFCQHSVLIIVLIYPPYFSRVAPLQSLSQVERHPERYPVWHQTTILAFQNFLPCPLPLSPVCIQIVGCHTSLFPMNQSLTIINSGIRNINAPLQCALKHTPVYGCFFNFWHFMSQEEIFIKTNKFLSKL